MSASIASAATLDIDTHGICPEHNIFYISTGFNYPEDDEDVGAIMDMANTIALAAKTAISAYLDDQTLPKSNTIVANLTESTPEQSTYEVFDLTVNATEPFAVVVMLLEERCIQTKFGVWGHRSLNYQAIVYHASAVPKAMAA